MEVGIAHPIKDVTDMVYPFERETVSENASNNTEKRNTENYILKMLDIEKSFFGVQVLNKANLRVRAGEVHVLLGENGAGKSTLIKILSGAYRREAGEIYIDGKPFHAETPKEALNAGISVIYQEFNLVPYLSIFENIFLGKEYGDLIFVDKKKSRHEAMNYMKMIGINVPPETLIAKLSIAQKQLVEIAKSISNDVKILILDEPTAAITDKETRLLFAKINELKAQGIGIVYISHCMQELFEIGDRCTVMRDGQFVAEVSLNEVSECDLTRMMVDREISLAKTERPKHPKEPILEVRDLCYRNQLHNVNLIVEKGEIHGIFGLVGAGRSELARCIIGDLKKSSGLVLYHGKELVGAVHETIRRGIVYLSEDRKDAGLVLMHSIADNIALPNLKQFGGIFLNRGKIVDVSKIYIKDLHIKPGDHRAEAKNLSGGNQQKVVIAKWLCSKFEFTIRYVLGLEDIQSNVCGIRNVDQLREDIAIIEKGPLDKSYIGEIAKIQQSNKNGLNNRQMNNIAFEFESYIKDHPEIATS